MYRRQSFRAVALAGAGAAALLTASAAFAQDPAPAPVESEEVVIVGVRGSSARAIRTKRNATTVTDSISAKRDLDELNAVMAA